MPQARKTITIGIDPELIDFSSPDFAAFPGLTADKINAATQQGIEKLRELGYDAEFFWVDFGETAVNAVKEKLSSAKYDIVLVAAGIRMAPSNLFLFEKILNTVIEFAPGAKICFNTGPTDSVDAFQRWS